MPSDTDTSRFLSQEPAPGVELYWRSPLLNRPAFRKAGRVRTQPSGQHSGYAWIGSLTRCSPYRFPMYSGNPASCALIVAVTVWIAASRTTCGRTSS